MSKDTFDKIKTPGVNWYQTKAGEVDSMHCLVCGAECTVERNVYRKPSATMYMFAGLHDEFTCPHSGEEWHWKAGRFVIEMHRTSSKRLRELIFLDMIDFLSEQGVQYPVV